MGGYLSHGNGKYGVVTGIFVRGVMYRDGRHPLLSAGRAAVQVYDTPAAATSPADMG